MLDLDGRTLPVHNLPPPVPATPPPAISCGTLFTDPAGDDIYIVEGQVLGPRGSQPQLDILSGSMRSEEHTSELQSRQYLVCRLLLEKKKTHYLNASTVQSRNPTASVR